MLKKKKPLLRGYSHQVGAFLAFIVTAVVIIIAPNDVAAYAAAIYGLSVVILFGTSAVYHRPTWQQKQRQLMRRLDHSAIFLLIAGTYTPLVLLVFPKDRVEDFLTFVWAGALVGVLQSIFWVNAPKILVALLCIALGWVVVFEWDSMSHGLTFIQLALIVLGGIFYTLGAVVYALRRPDPCPRIFGYHEIFHALTIASTICHGSVIIQVIMASS